MANFLDLLSGVGTGFAQAETRNIEGAKLDLDKRKMKLAEDRMNREEHAVFAKNAEDQIKNLAGSLKSAIEMFPGGREAALQDPRIASLAKLALESGRTLDEGSKKLYGKPAFALGVESIIRATIEGTGTAKEKGEAKGAEEKGAAVTGLSPEEKGQREGEAAVAAATAKAKAVADKDEAIQPIVKRLLGMNPPEQTAFQKELGALMGHVRGQTLGTIEGQFTLQRLNSILNENQPTDQGTVNIAVDQNGRVVVSSTGARKGTGVQIPGLPGTEAPQPQTRESPPGSGLKGAEIFKQSEGLDRLNAMIKLTDDTLAEIKRNPTAFGAVGTARGIAQGVGGVASDIGSILEKATGIPLGKYAAQSADRVARQFGSSDFTKGLFDPQLPRNELTENTLALNLAISRVERAGGDIRALESAFKAAKDDVKLTGLTSSRSVEQRMTEIKAMFEQERDLLNRRLTGSKSGGQKLRYVPGKGVVEE